MDRKRNITGVAPAIRSTQLKEGALQKGLPEPVAIPNDREELAQKGVILFFQLWQVPKWNGPPPNVDGMLGSKDLGHVL